jgi:hypothetical protein
MSSGGEITVKRMCGVAAGLVGASVALLFGGPTLAAQIPDTTNYVYVWQITGVGSPYTTAGPFHDCVSETASSDPGPLSCSLTTSRTNAVYGTVNVSDSAVSAAVGFNVSYQWSIQTTFGPWTPPVNTPAHISWRVQWLRRHIL